VPHTTACAPETALCHLSPPHNLRCVVPAPQWTLARVKAECIFAAGLEEEDEEDMAFWDITNGNAFYMEFVSLLIEDHDKNDDQADGLKVQGIKEC